MRKMESIKHLLDAFERVCDPAPLNRARAHFIQSIKYKEAGNWDRANQYDEYAMKELEHYKGTEFDFDVDEVRLKKVILP